MSTISIHAEGNRIVDESDEEESVENDEGHSTTSSIDFNDTSGLMQDLEELFESNELSDVQITSPQCERGEISSTDAGKDDENEEAKSFVTTIHGYSTILKARSVYFKCLLSSQWCPEKVLEKPNIRPEILFLVMKYLHTGIITLDTNGRTILDILIAADELCLEELTDVALRHIRKEFTCNPEAFWDYLEACDPQYHSAIPDVAFAQIVHFLSYRPRYLLYGRLQAASVSTIVTLMLSAYHVGQAHTAESLRTAVAQWVQRRRSLTSEGITSAILHADIGDLKKWHRNFPNRHEGIPPLFLGDLEPPERQSYHLALLLDNNCARALKEGSKTMEDFKVTSRDLKVALVNVADEDEEETIIGVKAVVVRQQKVLPKGALGTVITFDRDIQCSYPTKSEREDEWDGGGNVVFSHDTLGNDIIVSLKDFSRRRSRKVLVIRAQSFYVSYEINGVNVVEGETQQ